VAALVHYDLPETTVPSDEEPHYITHQQHLSKKVDETQLQNKIIFSMIQQNLLKWPYLILFPIMQLTKKYIFYEVGSNVEK